MKLGLLMSVALVVSFSANVYGEDCDLEIRDGTAAQDLSRILHCFDRRLKNLENKAGDLDKRPSSSGPTRNPTEFDAGMFVISVRAVSRQGNCIRLGVAIRNKTTEEGFLAMIIEMPVLIDEEKGISIALFGNSADGIRRNNGSTKEQDYTPIPPNTVSNFSLKFCSDELQNSRLFRLTLHLLSLKNQQIKRITAPLSVTFKDN
jgi:hypothetical protein